MSASTTGNLVSLVMQYLTPERVGMMARALNLDGSALSKTTGAAVPTLLGSLAGLASTPGGAAKVTEAITSHGSGSLDGILASLTGARAEETARGGSGMLSSLLGSAALPALAGALSRFTGLGQGTVNSVLGLLAPMVMGVLGREKAASGLDAAGVGRLLASQKDNIAASMPAGLADMLRGTGIPGFGLATDAGARVSEIGMQAEQAARSAFEPAATTARAAADRTADWATTTAHSARTGLPGWVTWAIPAALVLAALLWFMNRGTQAPERPVAEPSRQAAPEPPRAVAPGTPGLVVGGVDLAGTAQSTFDQLRGALQGVTDPASAQAALPRLRDASAQLDRLVGLSDQLPPAGRSALATLVSSSRPSIEALIERVLGIPGVGPVIAPVAAELRARLDTLGRA